MPQKTDLFPPAKRRLIPVLDRIRRSEALVYAIGIDVPNTGGHDQWTTLRCGS
jgi:hypothetical protein